MTRYLFILIVLTERCSSNYFGILNHQTQWHMHCSTNQTSILHPSLNQRSVITYECPRGSSSLATMKIIPIDIDFTLLCRLSSRLLWIIVDFYQYNAWLGSFQSEDLLVSIRLNEELLLNHSKSEMNHYRNRSILIDAFYIPFESIDHLKKRWIDIEIQVDNANRSNRCFFFLRENITWMALIENHCHSDQPRTIFVQYARCDFYPLFRLKEAANYLDVQLIDETLTNIPDFNVVLSIDQQRMSSRLITSTTTSTTTMIRTITAIEKARLGSLNSSFLFDELDRKFSPILHTLTSFSNIVVLMLIFSIMTLILIIILFLYVLCYHYHSRPSSPNFHTSI